MTILMCGEKYPEEIRIIEKMAKETSTMLISSVDALSEEKMEKAQDVIGMDDTVDALFIQFKQAIAEWVIFSITGEFPKD
ncbi:MAG: hypothetical protein HUJ72_03870 [Blautia sp.]|nr:hypothetical protein [Blautia sp.]